LPLFNVESKNAVSVSIITNFAVKQNTLYSENLKNFLAENSPASRQRGGASGRSADKKNIIPIKENQFETNNIAAGIKPTQTFNIILPNLIHKSKKRNLKR